MTSHNHALAVPAPAPAEASVLLTARAYAVMVEAAARSGRAAEITGRLLDARDAAPCLDDRVSLGDLAHDILARSAAIDAAEGSWFERGMIADDC
jgi:hypothetical protein